MATIDLPALQAFVRVVQTGSFTRAAAAMHTQKAHLSRVVSHLEQTLGVRLLSRTTRALSLTEVGREFFERAVGILTSVEDAQRAVQKSQGEPRGTLRLTCGIEFGMIAVSDWINQYLQRYPGVRCDADFTSRIVDIVHEGFDLAIRVGPLADSTLVARKLGELNYGLYASSHYLRRHGIPKKPAELNEHNTLLFSGGSHQSTLTLLRNGEPEQLKLHPRLVANNVFAVRNAAIASLGIAQLPILIASPECKDGRLEPILTRWSLPTVPVHAVFASARFLTPKVRHFIELAALAMGGGSQPGQKKL